MSRRMLSDDMSMPSRLLEQSQFGSCGGRDRPPAGRVVRSFDIPDRRGYVAAAVPCAQWCSGPQRDYPMRGLCPRVRPAVRIGGCEMSAMNGSAVPFRLSRGVLVACMAIALLASALFASTASAENAAHQDRLPGARRLDQLRLQSLVRKSQHDRQQRRPAKRRQVADRKRRNPADAHRRGEVQPRGEYEAGFVGYVAKALGKTEKAAGHELQTLNISCPGETSGGLIGNGPLGTGLEAYRASKSEPVAEGVGALCLPQPRRARR